MTPQQLQHLIRMHGHSLVYGVDPGGNPVARAIRDRGTTEPLPELWRQWLRAMQPQMVEHLIGNMRAAELETIAFSVVRDASDIDRLMLAHGVIARIEADLQAGVRS